MIERTSLERAAEVIGAVRSVVVLAHEHPDGDAIGSALALSAMLEDKGIKTWVCCPGPFRLPQRYLFLPYVDRFRPASGFEDCEIAITVDCANMDRLEVFEPHLERVREIINIDHHPDNTIFGTINIVDPYAAATSEIVFAIAPSLNLRITREAATCLYVGIVTDTGRFQFSNTGHRTFKIAAELVEIGVNPSLIFENVYQNDSLQFLRLEGKVLSEAVFDERTGLVYAVVTRRDLEDFGVEMEETEDLIETLRSLKGHRIAAVLKEQEDGRIRVSLRSKDDIDIGSVARKLGGGGHRVAAGYTSGQPTIDEAVMELEEELGGV